MPKPSPRSRDRDTGSLEGRPRRRGVAARRQGAAAEPGAMPPVVAAVMRHGRDAWPAFLRTYTRFLLGCIRRLAEDEDERMDIYLHVCARLYADDCRRIRQFRGGTEDAPCKFTTWLAAVTLNLGREWIRQMRGRRRVFRGVKRLSMVHRLVFRYQYWEGFDAGETIEMLRLQHGIRVDSGRLEEVLAELRGTLGADRRWRLLSRDARAVRHLSLDAPLPAQAEGTARLQVADDQPDSDLLVRQGRALDALRAAVEALPESQREALALRFRDGLTAREIAAQLGLDSFKRVYDLQARALLQLRSELQSGGWELDDFPLNGEFPGGET